MNLALIFHGVPGFINSSPTTDGTMILGNNSSKIFEKSSIRKELKTSVPLKTLL